MDIGAEGNDEIADLLADAVSPGAFQIDRDGGRGGLGSQGCGVAWNLVPDQGDRILVTDNSCQGELHGNADQVHDNYNQEYLPEYAENGKSLSGTCHIHKGSADIEGKEGNDGRVQHPVDNA